ncbi:hypothetical protein NEF87_003691 [Candidatus Lokiarchaeum ossiferum]|uniref:peptidylprolyl isomerase n=1 Tax=Candidatus Lokiarchaeum ossiferum TaxID=2951803 RepID=A0ABY6HVI2_9ARCH|nr:hypothetical protein NEF87_003691 [Candidatus Lokiarchaeum sp. B-35]
MADEEKIVDVEVEETEEEKTKREEEEKKAKDAEKRKKKLAKETVAEGDMVFVDVLGKTLEEDEANNMVFQASNVEDAKLLPNYDPKNDARYINDLAIVGKKGFVEDKIDEILKSGIKFFEEKTVDLEPVDAFGEREGKKIEKVSQKQFMKDMNNEKPYPGAQYKDKKGRSGVVLRAAQGRLLVDFNHPLAGKKIQYRVKVTDKVEGFEGQASALLGRRLGGMQSMGEMFKFDHDAESKTLEVEIPQMLMFQLAQQQGGIYFKMGASMDLQEHLPDVDTVKFVEVFAKTPAPVAEHDHEHDHDHDHDHEE